MMNWKMMFAMLAGSMTWGSPIVQNRRSFFGLRRPTGSDLRNPTDPVQARRIEAAAAKRERRAEKLTRNVISSIVANKTLQTWKGPFPDCVARPNLDPTYVAK